jgi:oxazoline/thiazoline synthase
MIRRPIFSPHYRVEAVAGDGIVLLSENGQVLLAGRLHELVASCMDGRRSTEEIVEQLCGEASPAEVRDTLMHLEQDGYLSEAEESLSPGEAALWSIQKIDPQRAASRLSEITVSVKAYGSIAAEPFVEVLQSLHVRVSEDGKIGVVLTDDYLRSELQSYNEEALRHSRPWMLVKPVGCEIWVGPVFQPGRTGCWECLAERLRASRDVEAFLQEKGAQTEPFVVSRSFTPATMQLAWGVAATEVAEWIVRGEAADLEGRVLSLDVRSWQARTHTLIWRPQCPACSDPLDYRELPIAPIVLESRKKLFPQDGGHRTVPPEVTLARHERHVSPITGAVSRLTRQGSPSNGVIHAYGASHNFALRHRTISDLGKGLRSRSGGKGASDVQARASGLCEALERYSGLFRGDEPRRQARLHDLGASAIHPNACMRFSEAQYRERVAWNARGSRFNFVPVPFDEDAEVEWTPVWSMTHQEARFLPTGFCYYRYPVPERGSYCVACSNGSAAGNTLEEAILQGFLELVERDSVALWWYNRVQRPAVALDDFDEPYLQQVREYLREHNRDLWVLDLTSDLGIPTFAAISKRVDQHPEQIMFGFGAHLDVKVGLLRAVTELNQFLFGVLHPRSDRSDTPENEVERWLRTATVANQPYLLPVASTPPRTASDYPQLWTDDLRDDVRLCRRLVEQHGMEMLVLDQTRPDIGLPVVKVIVPGMRHFWARFAPGRLYDTPVQLGWLPRSLTEEQLNPVPIFV